MIDITNYLKLNIEKSRHFACFGHPETKQKMALCFCENETYLKIGLKNKNISIIILSDGLFLKYKKNISKSVVISEYPRYTFWSLHNNLFQRGLLKPKMEYGIGCGCRIHASAIVSDKVLVGNNVSIGARCVISDYTIIGDNSCIEPGAIVGAEGMQNSSYGNEKLHVMHAGGVNIGNNVMIMSNSVISKAVYMGFTDIGNDTVISILSSVGHSCSIGNSCNIAGNVIIGGSVRIGDEVWIGPSVTIKDGLVIGNRANIKLGSVVVKDVLDGELVSGNFAYDHRRHLRDHAKKIYGNRSAPYKVTDIDSDQGVFRRTRSFGGSVYYERKFNKNLWKWLKHVIIGAING